MPFFNKLLGLSRAGFTALEPVSENPKLSEICRKEKFTASFHKVEECDLKPGTYDIVTSTHTAYYYYNQPLAHEMLFHLLKPRGWMIVTLVSQFCVLNALTEELLGPHHQFALNAESYISLVSKLGMFSLRKVVPHEGGALDTEFYINSPENLRALEYILARHRLLVDELERERESFASILKRHAGWERLNLIMFFQKADWIRTSPSASYPVLPTDIDLEVDSIRREFVDLVARQSSNKRGVMELDIDNFIKEIRSGWWRPEVVNVLRGRLEEAAESAGGQVNRLHEQIDMLMQKLKSPGTAFPQGKA